MHVVRARRDCGSAEDPPQHTQQHKHAQTCTLTHTHFFFFSLFHFFSCEKKVEIDFHIADSQHDLRAIPRTAIDAFLTQAKCTVISTRNNKAFDSYLLSESSLFIFPTKIILKTCGTTMLLKSVGPILEAAKAIGATPDFLQFSRSNFMFPQKQHFPHRAFSEETEYLNKLLGKEGDAFVLGATKGPRWHLYIVDFNEVDASQYKQQTIEMIMFNLDPKIMRQFYQAQQASDATSSSSAAPMEESKEILLNSSGQGFANLNGEGSKSGDDATKRSGIDKLIPGSDIDGFLFSPCGYSCNALLNETYFTIHITPEPECSFVSFETNLNVKSYTALVNLVCETFRPGSFCLSLFVDELSLINDSRKGLDWNAIAGYTTKTTTHHTFQAGYNATCAHYEITEDHPHHGSDSFGVPAATAAAAVKKASDNFCEQTNLATKKLQEHLDEVVEKAKHQEAQYNKIASEKSELERTLAAAAAKEAELLARLAAFEAKANGAAPMDASSSDSSDSNKKRKVDA